VLILLNLPQRHRQDVPRRRRPLVVIPVYTGNATHDAAVSATYAAHLPTKSEAAVDALLDERDANGAPIAIEIDTHFYFLCAVVSPNAAK
jgi:hypothetical protein